MANDTVIKAMKNAYEKNEELSLAERIMKTLKAAQKA
jgi:hypothetical protein